MLGLGNNLSELKIRIQKAHEDLASLGEPTQPLAEMIGSTNAIRLSEYLSKTDAKKTELIADYVQYTKQLEQIISSLFSIQSELKNILKEETTMMESVVTKPKKTKKSTKRN
jgi:phage-related protein